MKTLLPLISLFTMLIVGCASTETVKESEGQATEPPGCKLSDLNINVNIPKGYTRIPMECPKVAYKRNLSSNHARGFYIINTPSPYHSSDKESLAEMVDIYILATRARFDQTYTGQSYNTWLIDESTDFPPSLIALGGACGGLGVRHPEVYLGHEGVEWRRGIMCLVELPPKGSEKWTLIVAFFFDKNFDRIDYKPQEDFDRAARKLFRSIRIRDEE